MGKFKVGDRVEVIKDYDSAKTGMRGTILNCNSFIGSPGIKFDEPFFNGHSCDGKCQDGYGYFVSEENLKLIDTNSSIHIYTDGTTTTAILKDGKKVIKKAQAKCSPDDTFDFNIGAKLAFDRLMGIETPKKNKSVAKDCTGMRVKILNVDGFSRDHAELSSYIGKTGTVKRDWKADFRFYINYDINYMNEIDKTNGGLCFNLENVEFI